MALIVFLAFACMFFEAQAATCTDNPHCSDCDEKSGRCLKCHAGFWDKHCSLKCSSGCRNNTCEITTGGIESCTTGCVLGLQGTSCSIPCRNPGEQCTLCPGGCEEGYCQLGSTCVSGCVDSYYGSDCRPCSSRCRSCNRITGICEECHPPYVGRDCEHSCANCSGSCDSECLTECSSRFYEMFCIESCNENCISISNACPLKCSDKATVNFCTPTSHNQSGECTGGCEDGWYGPTCSSRCDANCLNHRCDVTGSCVEGCKIGFFGKNCTPCSETCLNHTCHSNTGSCTHGCSQGWYGEVCNQTCAVCRDGVCHQKTGTCIKGCSIIGCDPSCTGNCSIEECRKAESCKPEAPSTSGAIIGILVTSLFGILLLQYIWYRKRLSTQRRHQLETAMHNGNGQVSQPILQYQGLHRYYELHDEDMDLEFFRRNQLETGTVTDAGQVSVPTHEYQVIHRYYGIHDEDVDPELPRRELDNVIREEEDGAVEDESDPTISSGIEDGKESDPTISSGIEDGKESDPKISSGIEDGKESDQTISSGMEDGKESEPAIPRGIEDGKESEPAIPSGIEDGKESEPAIPSCIEDGKESEPAIPSGIEDGKKSEPAIPSGIEDGKESEPATPALAEYFPVSSDVEEGTDATSVASAEDVPSYTRLLQDVFVDDPTTVVTYLTPREDSQ